MAVDDTDENGGGGDPATLLKSLQGKALLNKYLFIATLCFSGIILSVMGTGMTVMYLKLSALEETAEQIEETSLEEQFATLEQQLMLLANFRKSEMKQINAYTRQLDEIAADCDIDKTAPYREFLLNREGDFQQFVDTLKEGTSALARMNQGSRDWLEEFNSEMTALKQASAARQARLRNLMADEDS